MWACEHPEAPWSPNFAYDERCYPCVLAAQAAMHNSIHARTDQAPTYSTAGKQRQSLEEWVTWALEHRAWELA
jgi:hypothetical protein